MAEHESRSANLTTNHDEIRKWVEARGGHPACVKGTGHGQGDVGMIRIDFPGFGGEGKLEPISWEQWFKQFDDNDLALLISPEAGNRFNKLVSRDNPALEHRAA